MRRLRIMKINPVSAFKAGLGVGAVVGAIGAVVYILLSFAGGIADHGILKGIGSGILSIFASIFFGLLYMLATGLFCWINAQIYNIIAKQLSPLEIVVSGD